MLCLHSFPIPEFLFARRHDEGLQTAQMQCNTDLLMQRSRFPLPGLFYRIWFQDRSVLCSPGYLPCSFSRRVEWTSIFCFLEQAFMGFGQNCFSLHIGWCFFLFHSSIMRSLIARSLIARRQWAVFPKYISNFPTYESSLQQVIDHMQSKKVQLRPVQSRMWFSITCICVHCLIPRQDRPRIPPCGAGACILESQTFSPCILRFLQL